MVRKVLGVVAASAAVLATVGADAADGRDRMARGRYLVEQVGMCDDCHTPRDASGRPDQERRLHGSTVDFQPMAPLPQWAGEAPSLAGGRQGWTRTQMIEFLSTGANPSGAGARPPMPPYRLTRQDAEAVAVYLESLPAPGAAMTTKAKAR